MLDANARQCRVLSDDIGYVIEYRNAKWAKQYLENIQDV